ncbi:MAG: hypothetical protein JRF33_26700 [Deltaproteobacteria bacterium]|nr:hypothetical protein [Deltaproteobacteria bacterium]
MNEEKKYWFHRVNFNLWLPLSWEGWALTFGTVGAIFLIFKLNGLTGQESIVLAKHWPVLLEMGVAVAGFYWLSRGHVRR